MIELPNKNDLQTLRNILDASGYNSESLTRQLGAAMPPDHAALQGAMFRTSEVSAANTLIRLFLLGVSVDSALYKNALPAAFLDACNRIGVLEVQGDRTRANVVIVPIDDLLFASDAFHLLGSADAAEFVLPASTHSANFLRRLMMRTKVGNVLDLGCGCGIHALFAARHSGAVVATDISPQAVRYTKFNAMLNGIENVECVTGDLFEPVGARSFDLIVSNPPFVIGPSEEFTYRDNRMQLDEFCRHIVGEAAAHLSDGGHLQMLFESVEVEGEAWDQRVRSWAQGTRCDTWLLHSPPIGAVAYAGQRLSDVSDGSSTSDAKLDDWVDYLASHRVTAIHPGMIVLRKRKGPNWFHVHNVASDVTQDAGDAVLQSMIAYDLLDRCGTDDDLLDVALRISSNLTLEQKFARTDDAWGVSRSTLRMSNGLPMDAEVDTPILAFMNALDGQKKLRACIDEFSKAVGAPNTKVTADLLPIVRLFIGRGYLEEA